MTLPESTVATIKAALIASENALGPNGSMRDMADANDLLPQAIALLDAAPPPAMGAYVHEDELPKSITDEQYAAWYKRSWIPGGVGCRVGPPVDENGDMAPAMGGLSPGVPENLTMIQGAHGWYPIQASPKEGMKFVIVEVVAQGTRDRLGELEGREAVAWAVAYDGAITGNLFPSEKGARRCMEQLNTQFPNEKREIFSLVIGARDGVGGTKP